MPAELRERLARARECVDLLNRLWPRVRSAGTGAAAEDAAGSPQKHRAEGKAPGDVHLPGFQVLEEIGRGGMGIVYRAIQPGRDREVAVKVLPPHLAADHTRLRRFRKESKLAARLSEASILPVLEAREVDGVPYIVMPYVEGWDLGRVITDRCAALRGELDGRQSRHPWADLDDDGYLDRALLVLDRLVEAVAALHRADVIHRDIKPSNVLLDHDGNVWLTDFGLATLTGSGDSSLTAVGTQLGSPGLMSPEQWGGREDLDHRVDVFGLGATIYNALTLRLPYGTRMLSEREPLALPPRRLQRALRRDHDTVILGSLEPDRRDRYTSAVEFADDWRRVRGGLCPSRKPVGWSRWMHDRLGR